MADAFVWWLWVELLGIIALPATFYLFRNLPDRGYAFSKVLALLLLGYSAWLAATLRLLPNARGASILLLFLLAIGSLFLFARHRRSLIDFLSASRTPILITEALFTGAFILWAVVRAYNPEIQHTEQPMDFAFLNAILRSEFFPPNDPWLSGHSISYYYFGYLIMAQLINLSGVASSIGYNLAMALLFAMAAAGAFSIVFNLVSWRRSEEAKPGRDVGIPAAFGVLAALLLVGVGNLEGVLETLHSHGMGTTDFWQWIGIKGLAQPYNSSQWFPTDGWWWWRATRVIDTVVGGKSLDYTITEFPYFSFLLGDLHPHVMGLPFVLVSLALSLNIFRASESVSLAWPKQRPLEFLAIALCLGGLSFINSWDFPTFTLIFLAAAMLRKYILEMGGDGHFWRGWLGFAVLLGITSIVLYLPFYVGFRSQVGGILPVQSVGTRPVHYVIFWGMFLFLSGSFAIARLWSVVKRRDWERKDFLMALLTLVPLVLWIVVIWGMIAFTGGMMKSLGDIYQKLVSIWPLLVVVGLLFFLVINRARAMKRSQWDRWAAGLFPLLLLLCGLALTFGCELFFIRDSFGNRMNTVFKFYYQAWVLLAIASAFGSYYIVLMVHRAVLSGWLVLAAIVLVASLVFPVTATYSKTSFFGREPTLDGLAHFQASNPAEYEAIQWLSHNTRGAPVIVEATGGEYSQYGRVSTYTGLPTLLGWAGHEIQWRGSAAPFAGRAEDIATIYQSEDMNLVASLLKKYNVSYVYVGRLETGNYGTVALDRFKDVLDVAFRNQAVTIYRVRMT
ncbi:MAG: DUF2298 domain-containing protein [Chloroflexota bacterium]